MEYIVYIIVSFLQPICWPLPEMSTILYGTLRFGPHIAFLLAYIFIVLGIIFMYKISFYLSDKYLSKLKKSKNFKKYQKFVIKNQILTTGILFILPILPDEIICVGSAIIGIKFNVFVIVALFAKFISIGMVTYSNVLSKATGLNQPVIIAFELVLIFTSSYLYNKKKNGTKNV